MKVTVIFEQSMEEDGTDTNTIMSNSTIEDMYGLLQLYGDAARAAGFTYVDRVGFCTDKGAETWGEF